MSDNNASDSAILQYQAAKVKRLVHTGLAVLGLLVVAAIVLLILNQMPSKPNTAPEPIPLASLTTAEIEQLRQQFKQQLTAYEAEIQPILDNSDFANWSEQAFELAVNLKDKALAEFASTKYEAALDILEQSQKTATEAEILWHQAFQTEIARAHQAFAEGEAGQAQLAVNKAANIKSSDPAVLALQQRLDVYPEVETRLNQLEVAVTENNLAKQIKLMREILTLDSSRMIIKGKLDRAIRQQQDLDFQRLIDSGLKQLEQGDFQAADQSYNEAYALFPNRPELQVLAEKLDKQEYEFTLDSIHQELAENQASDNWQKVLELTEQAQAYFPSDAVIISSQKQAQTILRLQAEVADYVARPHRLADTNIQVNAKAVIRKALPYLSASPSLSADIAKIGESIDSYNKTYPVMVTSDNRTFIKVLGQGSVGKIKRKTIHLPAGTYTLEGSRKGYKNKQMTLVVEASQNNSINLVCNEQI